MKTLELKNTGEKLPSMGSKCPFIKPNITESTIFTIDNEPVGFYLKELPERIVGLLNISNTEFRSNRVPKSTMFRSDQVGKVKKLGLSYAQASKISTQQYSTILGSIPRKEIFKRIVHNISQVQDPDKHPEAGTFVKVMWKMAEEVWDLTREVCPKLYDLQVGLLKQIEPEWIWGKYFTSSISNYNISAAYHQDLNNLKGSLNVILTKRFNAEGGCLNVPEYGITIEQANNSLLVYPAWKNLHGVTPINPLKEDGYRNSFIFYTQRAFRKEIK